MQRTTSMDFTVLSFLPSVAELVSQADVMFVNGLKLEDPTKEIAEQNIPKCAEVVELGRLTITPDEYIYEVSFPQDGGKPNPHPRETG